MRTLGEEITEFDGRVSAAEAELRELLLGLPNTPLQDVPIGGVEANEEVRTWGSPPQLETSPVPHWEIGDSLGLIDLRRGAKVSGSGPSRHSAEREPVCSAP